LVGCAACVRVLCGEGVHDVSLLLLPVCVRRVFAVRALRSGCSGRDVGRVLHAL